MVVYTISGLRLYESHRSKPAREYPLLSISTSNTAARSRQFKADFAQSEFPAFPDLIKVSGFLRQTIVSQVEVFDYSSSKTITSFVFFTMSPKTPLYRVARIGVSSM